MKLKKSALEKVEAEGEKKEGEAFLAERFKDPTAEIAADKVEKAHKADWIGAVCAIVATLLLCVVTALLYMNWEAIKMA